MKKYRLQIKIKMSNNDSWIYAIFNSIYLARDRGYDISPYIKVLDIESEYRTFLAESKRTEDYDRITEALNYLMSEMGFIHNNLIFMKPDQQSFLIVRFIFDITSRTFDNKEASNQLSITLQDLPDKYQRIPYEAVMVVDMLDKKIKHQALANIKQLRVFSVRELKINPVRHKLYDPHQKLEKDSSEYQEMLGKAQGEISNLYRSLQGIYRMDIICRYFGFETGDIIKITNTKNVYWNSIVNTIVSYRIVKNLEFKPSQ